MDLSPRVRQMCNNDSLLPNSHASPNKSGQSPSKSRTRKISVIKNLFRGASSSESGGGIEAENGGSGESRTNRRFTSLTKRNPHTGSIESLSTSHQDLKPSTQTGRYLKGRFSRSVTVDDSLVPCRDDERMRGKVSYDDKGRIINQGLPYQIPQNTILKRYNSTGLTESGVSIQGCQEGACHGNCCEGVRHGYHDKNCPGLPRRRIARQHSVSYCDGEGPMIESPPRMHRHSVGVTEQPSFSERRAAFIDEVVVIEFNETEKISAASASTRLEPLRDPVIEDDCDEGSSLNDEEDRVAVYQRLLDEAVQDVEKQWLFKNRSGRKGKSQINSEDLLDSSQNKPKGNIVDTVGQETKSSGQEDHPGSLKNKSSSNSNAFNDSSQSKSMVMDNCVLDKDSSGKEDHGGATGDKNTVIRSSSSDKGKGVGLPDCENDELKTSSLNSDTISGKNNLSGNLDDKNFLTSSSGIRETKSTGDVSIQSENLGPCETPDVEITSFGISDCSSSKEDNCAPKCGVSDDDFHVDVARNPGSDGSTMKSLEKSLALSSLKTPEKSLDVSAVKSSEIPPQTVLSYLKAGKKSPNGSTVKSGDKSPDKSNVKTPEKSPNGNTLKTLEKPPNGSTVKGLEKSPAEPQVESSDL